MLSLKKTIFFFSLNLALIFSFNSYSQCGISGLELSNASCIENASYEFDLNFVVAQSALDSFNVYINDDFKGRYSPLQLPVHIVNDRYYDTDEDIVKVEDNDNTDCFEEASIDNPCGCAQFDFEYTKINCTDTTFNLMIDFNYLHTGDSFDIGMIRSPFGSHAYKDLPFKIGPFKSADTTYLLFIADKSDFFCFMETPVNGRSCPPCNMSDLNMVSYDCNNDFKKNITFTMNYTNPESDKYNIFVNNEYYGSYDFRYETMVDSVTMQDTFHIGPIDIDCDSTLKVRVEDSENPDCNTMFETDSICCEICEIGNLQFRDKEYTSDSTLNFILDFDYFRNRTDSFKLTSSNGIKTKYSVEDLPVHITNYFIGDTEFDTIEVCMDNGRCCSSAILEFPVCEIGELVFNDRECNSDSTFNFILNFNYVRSRTDSFQLTSSNGMSQTYSVDELPLHINDYPITDIGFDTLQVCIDNGRCCSIGIVEFPFCDYFGCNLENVTYVITFDTIESYWVTLDFSRNNTSDSFSIQGNGLQYGNFNYNELPVTLGPYNCKDSLMLEYVIKDLEVENCDIVLEAGMVTCPPNYVQDIDILDNWVIKYSFDSRMVNIFSTNSIFDNAKVDIFDIKGVKLSTYKLPNGLHSSKLRLNNLNTGIYLLRFSNNGKIKTKKIFIE